MPRSASWRATPPASPPPWPPGGRHFDLALLDPPRAGARDLLPALCALGPRRIAYASCDPGTLARDLAELCRSGYRVRATMPVDMFPQTFHVEALVVLER